MKTLKINSTNGKLNLADLPHNCIFNKKITGCGGTTIALFNDENYVIAVPTTELVINKTGNSEAGTATITNYDGKKQTILGLFGNFSYYLKKQVKEYLETEGTKKIICTYDKINALTKLLNPSDYRILVDEYQILLKAYSYRQKAINGVLDNFRNYKSFCFMSATPINSDFKPSALNDIEELEAVWNETDTLNVVLDYTNHPYQKVANIITEFKHNNYQMAVDGGNVANELFFFLNSVTDIASILEYCELKNEEVKIVCADTEENSKKLAGYIISNSRSENRPITFITSKSFEGADYFSETGVSFVVSNSRKQQTLLDISTDIYQIAGRIRNEDNPNRNLLIHIFNTAGRNELHLDITYEQMVELVSKNIKGANEIIELVNNSSESAKSMASKLLNCQYVSKDSTGRYYLNDTLIKLELFNYNINQQIYKNGISITKAYEKTGAIIFETESKKIDNQISYSGKKLTFKEAFLKYSEIKNNPYDMTDTSYLVKVQPLIVPAYQQLGEKKVKSLRYIKKEIEAALLNADKEKSLENKIAALLNKELSFGFISSKDLIGILTRIYTRLDITTVVKATAIEKYFECKATTKRINDNIIRGYEIYRPKLIFK